jgi:hypothetical protein
MPSKLSTIDLFNRAKRYVRSKGEDDIDILIEDSIIKADREIWDLDMLYPIAWRLHPFMGLRTSTYAQISALTAADPGVFTAASVDNNITGHGFRDNTSSHQDIVFIDGIDAPEALNNRLYLLEYASATTFSLKTLDGLDAVDTSGLDAYTSGGTVYHAGIKLHEATILANVDTKWTFGGIPTNIDAVSFDGYPAVAIPEAEVLSKGMITADGACRPRRFRYWRNITAAGTEGHHLLWYPFASSDYNIGFQYLKEVSDISTFSASTYSFHPHEIHDYIWRGALANLVGESKRMERNNDKVIATQLEVMWANKWLSEWEDAKRKIIRFSRSLGGFGGITDFSA